MRPAEKKLWRIAGTIAVSGAVIAFLSHIYTWKVYYDTLPHSPDTAAGRLYVDNFHGFARYETRAEYARLHTLDHLSEALIFLVIVGAAVYEWRKRRLSEQQTVLPPAPSVPRGGQISP